MFRQILTDSLFVLGIAVVIFFSQKISHWVILDPGLAGDALPLSIIVFLNEFGAFLLALIAYRSGSFLGLSRTRTVPGHLVLSFVFLAVLIGGLVWVNEGWLVRLKHARDRISLIEEQSLKRELQRPATHFFEGGRLILSKAGQKGAWFDRSGLAYAGEFDSETWTLTNALHLSTNITILPRLSLPGSLQATIPSRSPSLISSRLDPGLANFFTWPLKHPGHDYAEPLPKTLFLIGLIFFAHGAGLLVNRPRASVFIRTFNGLVFILAVALPSWLFHLWWLGESSGARLSGGNCVLRALFYFIPGAILIGLGYLRRHRQLEGGH